MTAADGNAQEGRTLLPCRSDPTPNSQRPVSMSERVFLQLMAVGCVLIVLTNAGALNGEDHSRRHVHDPDLLTEPDSIELVKDEVKTITFSYTNVSEAVTVKLKEVEYLKIDPLTFEVSPSHTSQKVNVTGVAYTSRVYIDVSSCATKSGRNCSVEISKVFVTVKVMHSSTLKVLIEITGWAYFIAWSISFYPQIILNYQRKSVEGLNFDFLILNIIGFSCYTVYNVLLYFDGEVQDLYVAEHPRGVIPVLMNDVVFAIHALAACIITGLQCFIYQRGNQRISYICMGWGSLLILVALGCFVATLFSLINWLRFISILSQVKLAVTCSKYIPQAILNFRRKSTVGWSIGNILLDFTGGSMDILQMVLQGANTDDWSAFTGNVVKFGLGLVSMVFDALFMVQHYCLYRNHDSFDLESPDERETGSVETDTSQLEQRRVKY